MRRERFRLVYVLVLGLLAVLGLGVSSVQASKMAAGMSMSGQHMSASGGSDCGLCKETPSGAEIMVCDATCTAPVSAAVPQLFVLLIQRPVDRPLSESPIPSGWITSPNPHPPKRIVLI